MAKTAKIFSNGGSQAVRLPKEFRFGGKEVMVRRLGRGVLLEPVGEKTWGERYWAEMPVIADEEWVRPSDRPPLPIERERDLP